MSENLGLKPPFIFYPKRSQASSMTHLTQEWPQYCWEVHGQLWLVNENATSEPKKGGCPGRNSGEIESFLTVFFPPFLGTLFALEKCSVCSVEQRAQHRSWRGAVSGWTSPQGWREEFPSRNLREKRSVLCFLEDRNPLKLRSLDPSSIFPKWYYYLGTMNSNAPNAMIARLEQPSGPPNAMVAEGRNRGKTPNAIIAKENGLDSLFKEVRVF